MKDSPAGLNNVEAVIKCGWDGSEVSLARNIGTMCTCTDVHTQVTTLNLGHLKARLLLGSHARCLPGEETPPCGSKHQ